MSRIITLIIMIAAVATLAGRVVARTDTTFTYQGQLTDRSEPANGQYNFEFSLWDAEVGGNQIGLTEILNGVQVTEGLVNVELDFGAEAFNGDDRWLEIDVDGNILDPRQSITRAPYSIQTRGIFVDANNNVGIGTSSPTWELEVANLAAGDGAESGVTADDAGGAMAAYSSTLPPPFEHYAGRVSLFSNAVTTGLDVRADASNGDIRFYTGGPWPSNLRMRISHTGNVSIGSWATGSSRVHVESEAGTAIRGHANNGAGVLGSTDSNAGGVGLLGWSTAVSGTNYAVRGQCNSSSGYDFYADGPGQDYGSSSSIRWKNNISSIDDPLEKITALRGVYFDWDTEHGGHHDVGMIAEEVGAVLPEIVTYEENGIDAHGMDYSKLAPLLVEAVNALRAEKDAELDALAAENAFLRTRLDSLERLFSQLASQETEATR